MESCETSGIQVSDHFREVTEMVPLGSGSHRPVKDYMLTRYACYLIAQNGDPKKEEIARVKLVNNNPSIGYCITSCSNHTGVVLTDSVHIYLLVLRLRNILYGIYHLIGIVYLLLECCILSNKRVGWLYHVHVL